MSTQSHKESKTNEDKYSPDEKEIKNRIIKAKRVSSRVNSHLVAFVKKQEYLKEIIDKASIASIRVKAIEAINDEDYLVKLCLREKNKTIKKVIVERLNQSSLKIITINDEEDLSRIAAIRRITDTDFLEKIYWGEKNKKVKKILLKIIIDKAHQNFLKEVFNEEPDASIRTEVIKHIVDENFVIQKIRNEKNIDIKNALWRVAYKNTSILSKLPEEVIMTVHNKNHLGIILDATKDINKLRILALRKNPAKRIANEISQIKSSSFLKYLIIHGTTIVANNSKEWTDVVSSLSDEDMKRVKIIIFGKKQYSFSELCTIKDEHKLFEILLESNNHNASFYCISGINNQKILEEIVNKTFNHSNHFSAINKIYDEKILNRIKSNHPSDETRYYAKCQLERLKNNQ